MVDWGRENYNNLMQKWLDDNDILIYWTHNEGKSDVVGRFIRTLKGKINKKLIANDRNDPSYFGYLNMLEDEYSNNYHRSIGKNHIHADYPVLIEKIESAHKAPKLKLGDRVRITKYDDIFNLF